MFSKLIEIIPWGLKTIHRFAVFAIIAYVLLGSVFSLFSNLDIVYLLNILFGFGLIVALILVVPAIMSTDSGTRTASNIFIATVFSYPLVYLISLFAGSWIPGIESNGDLAIAISALPLINVIIFSGLVITLVITD